MTRRREVRRKLRLLVASTLLAALAGSVLGGAPAEAASTTHLRPVALPGGGQGFDNYDYVTPHGAANNVDWAVDLVFTNNATVNKTSAGWSAANPGWKYGANAFGWVNSSYDSSLGLKQYNNGNCSRKAENFHYRTYANPATDTLISTSYGYFVIGTAHSDFAENCTDGSAKTYNEEAAENYIGNMFVANHYAVYRNSINLSNAESARCENVNGVPHCWNNNGLATRIVIP